MLFYILVVTTKITVLNHFYFLKVYLQELESFLCNSGMTNIFVFPRDDNKREETQQICVKHKLCPPTNVITMDSGKDLFYDTLFEYGQTAK